MEKIARNRKKMTLGEFIAETVDVTFALWSDKQEAGMRFIFRWEVEGYVPRIRGKKPRCIEIKEDGFVVSSHTKLV